MIYIYALTLYTIYKNIEDIYIYIIDMIIHSLHTLYVKTWE